MRKYIIGAIIGAALTLSVGAASETISLVGKKIQGETEIVLQGQVVDSAIIVDGKSFAPVRVIGEAAGFEVGFENKKVVLNAPERGAIPLLPEMPVQEETKEEILAKINGEINNINNLLWLVEYDLKGREYELEKGTLVPGREEGIPALRQQVADLKAELAELERQKAELEQ